MPSNCAAQDQVGRANRGIVESFRAIPSALRNAASSQRPCDRMHGQAAWWRSTATDPAEASCADVLFSGRRLEVLRAVPTPAARDLVYGSSSAGSQAWVWRGSDCPLLPLAEWTCGAVRGFLAPKVLRSRDRPKRATSLSDCLEPCPLLQPRPNPLAVANDAPEPRAFKRERWHAS